MRARCPPRRDPGSREPASSPGAGRAAPTRETPRRGSWSRLRPRYRLPGSVVSAILQGVVADPGFMEVVGLDEFPEPLFLAPLEPIQDDGVPESPQLQVRTVVVGNLDLLLPQGPEIPLFALLLIALPGIGILCRPFLEPRG